MSQNRVGGVRTITDNNPKGNGKAVRAPGNVTRRRGNITNSGATPLATGLGRQIQAYPLLGEVVVELKSYSG